MVAIATSMCLPHVVLCSPQVCVAFQLYRGVVVIPKTTNPARVVENKKSTELNLDAEDMRRLREMDKNQRLLDGSFMRRTELTLEHFWDVESDKAFEVTEPAEKKARKEE